jgi:hypothetical protein
MWHGVWRERSEERLLHHRFTAKRQAVGELRGRGVAWHGVVFKCVVVAMQQQAGRSSVLAGMRALKRAGQYERARGGMSAHARSAPRP